MPKDDKRNIEELKKLKGCIRQSADIQDIANRGFEALKNTLSPADMMEFLSYVAVNARIADLDGRLNNDNADSATMTYEDIIKIFS